MSEEKERLISMLNDNKITESDYQLIVAALDKKSILLNIESSMLINPFQKIAGFNALLIGLAIMLMMSMLGIIAKMYFDGIFGCLLSLGIKTKFPPGFYLLLYQNLVNTVTLTILFLACAFLFKQKRIRIIDFFGTVALSRFPYLVLTGFFAALQLFDQQFFSEAQSKWNEMHFSAVGTLASFIWITCFIWQLLTYFFALKEASGLDGKRLWISFIVSLALSDMLSTMLARIFLYI